MTTTPNQPDYFEAARLLLDVQTHTIEEPAYATASALHTLAYTMLALVVQVRQINEQLRDLNDTMAGMVNIEAVLSRQNDILHRIQSQMR